MKLTRTSLAALLLSATTVAAFAQAPPNPTGKAQVEIKKATTTTTTTTSAAPAPKPSNSNGRMAATRDPFTSQVNSAPVEKPGGKIVHVNADKNKGKTKVILEKKIVVAPIKIAPPPVTVRGIVQSGRGSYAILASDKQNYMVRSGDKLGDYRVTAISTHTVCFAYKDKSFKLPLMAQFPGGSVRGAAGAAKSSKK